MIIRKLNNLLNNSRHIHGDGFESVRYLLEKDNMGFSLHRTFIPKGTERIWHYTHHLEACYCIQGKAYITNNITGDRFLILPDTMYALDQNDPHTFKAAEDTVLISIFNPPVEGSEIHDGDHSYPPSEYLRKKAKKIIDLTKSCDNDYDLMYEIEKIL